VISGVERLNLVRPAADGARHVHALFELALFADDAADARNLGRSARRSLQHFVEDVGDFAVDACKSRASER